MSNLKPYKFTKADSAKGGKKTGITRINTNNANKTIQAYLDSNGLFDVTNFTNDFLALTGKDRMNFLIAYLPFEKPKLAAVEQLVEVTEMKLSRQEREAKIIDILTLKQVGK